MGSPYDGCKEEERYVFKVLRNAFAIYTYTGNVRAVEIPLRHDSLEAKRADLYLRKNQEFSPSGVWECVPQ